MARLPVGTYLKFTDRAGIAVGLLLHNFHPGETRNWQGADYVFGNFGFSGSTVDIGAANISATLVFGLNELSLATFETAARMRWLAHVQTVWLEPDTLVEKNIWMTEIYSVNKFSRHLSRINVDLGSPLDATSIDLPRRVLTQALVGALPTTGQSFF